MAKAQDPASRLYSLPFFKGLPESDISLLGHESSIRHYPKGRHLFRTGDKADRFFVIVGGWVKLYRVTLEGAETITAILTRGDVFGESAILENADYTFSAEVAADACLVEIPAGLLKERAKINPDIMVRMMASMSRELNKLQMEGEHKVLMEASQRVGCLLLQLASGMDGEGAAFAFPYDKSLAAQRLGMRPETFSRALAQLKTAGVASKGMKITIKSFERLTEHSCGHCTAQLSECKGARIKAECRSRTCRLKNPPQED